MKRLLLLATLLATLVPTGSAEAGIYTVQACKAGVPNGSWSASARVRGVYLDPTCGASSSDFIGMSASNIAIDGGAATSLTFNAPAGTTIANFRYRRRIAMRGEAPAGPGTNKPYFLLQLGSIAYEGGGSCCSDKRTQLTGTGNWLDAGGNVAEVQRSSYSTLPDNASQTSISIRMGCFAANATCKLTDGGNAQVELEDISVNLQESSPPTVDVANEGLFAPGGRNAADPIFVTASDPIGISSVQLLDARNPSIYYARKFFAGNVDEGIPPQSSDGGVTCRVWLTEQCPQLSRERIAIDPDGGLTVGKYEMFVRVTDAAGNTKDSPVRAVSITTDVDRGAANGTPAADKATLSVAAPVIRARVGKPVTIGGRLVNEAGAPIAGAALGVTGVPGVTTAPDGSWSATLKAVRSRTINVGYRAYANDELNTARAKIQLQVPIGASVAAPKSVRAGKRFAIKGRIRGRKPTRKQLLLVAQAKVGKSWRVIGRARTKKQTYVIRARVRYRGKRAVRVVLRPRGRFPYETGKTRTLKVRVR